MTKIKVGPIEFEWNGKIFGKISDIKYIIESYKLRMDSLRAGLWNGFDHEEFKKFVRKINSEGLLKKLPEAYQKSILSMELEVNKHSLGIFIL